LSQTSGFNPGDTAVPVALTGRVPVKVSSENGPIYKGDYLTSSSVAGVAMKATKPGQVLGKALEDFTTSGTGKVNAFVNVSFADPGNTLSNLTVDDTGSLLIPAVKTSSLQLSGVNTTNLSAVENSLDPSILNTVGDAVNSGSDTNHIDLATTINTIVSAQKAAEDKIASLQNQTASLSSQVAGVASESASLAGQVASQSSQIASTSAHIASQDAALASASASIASISAQLAAGQVAPKLTDPSILIASDSAQFNNINVADTLSTLNIDSNEATVSGTLRVLGDTTLGSTSIAGNLNINGTFSVDSAANGDSINSLSTLYLQNSPLAEMLDIFNGNVTIDKSGNITTKGDIHANNLNLDGAITITATAGENINVGDVLYISAPGEVKKADSTIPAKSVVVGIAAQSAQTTETLKVIIGGKAQGFNNLQTGKKYYLGTAGAITTTIPLNSVSASTIGIAFSDKEIVIQLNGN